MFEFFHIFSTNSLRKCMAISLENLFILFAKQNIQRKKEKQTLQEESGKEVLTTGFCVDSGS